MILVLQLSSPGRAVRQTAAVLAVLLVVIAASSALGDLLQWPEASRRDDTPIAFFTAVAFILIGLALLSRTGSDTWPMSLATRRTSRVTTRLTGAYLALAGVLMAPVVASGYLYFHRERAEGRRRAAETVATVADLKVRQLADWYRERHADAAVIAKTPFDARLGALIAGRPDPTARSAILEWSDTLRREYGYSFVAFADADGAIRLSSSGRPLTFDAATVADIRSAARTNAIVTRDLNRRGTTILFFSPLASADAQAVLILGIDAGRFLFPLLEQWPAPSPTAEMILLRRDGADVIFLNHLRHRPGAPANIRMPFEQLTRTSAGHAVAGEEGAFEGEDYRNVRVVAALRSVPGTPWFLVAKVDQREVDLESRRQFSRTALFLAVVILVVAAGISLLWYRRGLSAAQRELVLGGRLRRMIDANMIGVLTAGAGGEIVEANDYFLRLAGATREDLERGRVDWRAITPPEWAEADERALAELRERGICTPYEKEYLRPDGTRVPVLLLDAILPGDEGQIAAFVLDLTDRKRAERELVALAGQRQLALDAAQLGWWTYHPITGVASLDDRTASIFGIEREGDIQRVFDRVHPDDLPRLHRAMQAALDPLHPEPYSIEYRVVLPDGSTRWIEALGITTFEGEGPSRVAVSFVGTVQNVTERRSAQTALSDRIDELRRWRDVTLNRENRIFELKREVNELLAAAGQPARYPSASRSVSREDVEPPYFPRS